MVAVSLPLLIYLALPPTAAAFTPGAVSLPLLIYLALPPTAAAFTPGAICANSSPRRVGREAEAAGRAEA